jgi:hypothetical protein
MAHDRESRREIKDKMKLDSIPHDRESMVTMGLDTGQYSTEQRKYGYHGTGHWTSIPQNRESMVTMGLDTGQYSTEQRKYGYHGTGQYSTGEISKAK